MRGRSFDHFHPWVDTEGWVHQPLWQTGRNGPVGDLADVRDLIAGVDDPSAHFCIEYDGRYCDDFIVLVYLKDQSDFYSI